VLICQGELILGQVGKVTLLGRHYWQYFQLAESRKSGLWLKRI
jgi:hypothetical protein